MKQIIIIIITGLLVYAIYQHFSGSPPQLISEIQVSTPTPEISRSVSYSDNVSGYSFVAGIDPQNMSLVPNFQNKYTAENLMKSNKCRYGINGGFYTEDNKPLGQFITNGTDLSGIKNSLTFNGFVAIEANNLTISDTNTDKSSIKLQTGPMLLQNSKIITLKLTNDKLARRMIMAKNLNNQAIIISVFDTETKKSGPLLVNLPEIVNMISQKENLEITDAVNLDGGRASAFYGADQILPETDPVGSWWCIK